MRWLRRIIDWLRGRRPKAVFDRSVEENPLREFVYLDEVSLRSLLSSKKGEMTATTMREVARSVEQESKIGSSLGVDGVAKAESSSRFQTRNSSTLQTAKKATVQSWFRELDKIKGIRLIETVQKVAPFSDPEDIVACDHRSVSFAASSLKRGELTEFKVRLSAHPIFHLVTVVSEFTGMAQDYPSMVTGNSSFDQLQEIEGIGKVLQRLLVGLVPVRAQVMDYVSVEIEGEEYLVHVDALTNLNVETKPVEIVCVTELDAYWKDIRRVLFAGAEFTILCRISEDGLQREWSPVKLTDLLKGLVPDLPKQLDFAADSLFDPSKRSSSTQEHGAALRMALRSYASAYVVHMGAQLDEAGSSRLNSLIDELDLRDQSASAQKRAFVVVRDHLAYLSDAQIDPSDDLALRENARREGGLGHFGSEEKSPDPSCSDNETENDGPAKRLLDVEVVAIYW